MANLTVQLTVTGGTHIAHTKLGGLCGLLGLLLFTSCFYVSLKRSNIIEPWVSIDNVKTKLKAFFFYES